jgi:hypothetical protein
LSAQLAKWLGKEQSRRPNESSYELEGIEGTLPTSRIIPSFGKLYMHLISRKSNIEELAMDDEDILRRVITKTRKMKK